MSRLYEESFKIEAVKMLYRSRKSIPQLAKELWVSSTTLRDWKHKYGNEETSPPLNAEATKDELITEVSRLHKELREVKEQREILKKAAAILGL